MTLLTVAFLALSVVIETAYSWPLGLIDPYYFVKLVGWVLLGIGVISLRKARLERAFAFLAAGWAWMGANFWRAVADRFARLADGETLPLGSVELRFASSCLLVACIGLVWSLVLASRRRPPSH